MTAPITSAIINCPIHIKTQILWKLCELSISLFCHVNICHEKDLSFKTQYYKKKLNQHPTSFLLQIHPPPPPIVFEKLVKKYYITKPKL